MQWLFEASVSVSSYCAHFFRFPGSRMASHIMGAESSIEIQMPSMGMEKPKRSEMAPMMAGVVIVEMDGEYCEFEAN